MMKLYVTPASPFARMARIVVIEKGLQDRVETVAAKTRSADSPYYRINPSGRVPYLVCEDGRGLEDSAVVCAYFDRLGGNAKLELPDDDRLEGRRLEAMARSMLDGLSVWNREMARPANERSPGVIRHEKDRAQRMADVFEQEVGNPLMRGPLNMVQITLACALGLEARNPEFHWRPQRPKLAAWFAPIAARPSFLATAPK
jgi:glutathione S-transferase